MAGDEPVLCPTCNKRLTLIPDKSGQAKRYPSHLLPESEGENRLVSCPASGWLTHLYAYKVDAQERQAADDRAALRSTRPVRSSGSSPARYKGG